MCPWAETNLTWNQLHITWLQGNHVRSTLQKPRNIFVLGHYPRVARKRQCPCHVVGAKAPLSLVGFVSRWRQEEDCWISAENIRICKCRCLLPSVLCEEQQRHYWLQGMRNSRCETGSSIFRQLWVLTMKNALVSFVLNLCCFRYFRSSCKRFWQGRQKKLLLTPQSSRQKSRMCQYQPLKSWSALAIGQVHLKSILLCDVTQRARLLFSSPGLRIAKIPLQFISLDSTIH